MEGSQGAGVMLAERVGAAKSVIIEAFRAATRPVLVQEFIRRGPRARYPRLRGRRARGGGDAPPGRPGEFRSTCIAAAPQGG